MASANFNQKSPRRPHLVRLGKGGVGGEVADLRTDIVQAFASLAASSEYLFALSTTILSSVVTTSLPNGAVAKVVDKSTGKNFIATYDLKKSSGATADGLNILTAPGTDRWLRRGFEGIQEYLTQGTWCIDAVAGNDQNDGLTSGTALKTAAEYTRRVGVYCTITVPTTVAILNDIPPTDPFILRPTITTTGSLTIFGTPTAVASGTGSYTAIQARTPATNLAAQVTDSAGRVWVPGQRVQNTGGTANSIGAYAWVLANLGANQARITPLGKMDPTQNINVVTEVVPVVNDTYAVYALAQRISYLDIQLKTGVQIVLSSLLGKLTIKDLLIGDPSGLNISRIDASTPQLQLVGCMLRLTECIGGAFYNCLLNDSTCYFGVSADNDSAQRIFAGGSLVTVNVQGAPIIDRGFTLNGNISINVSSSRSQCDIRDVMFFDWTSTGAALLIFQNGMVNLGNYATPGKLSGASSDASSFGVDIKSGRFVVPDATLLTIDGGASNAVDFKVAGLNALPIFDTTANPPAYVASTPANCNWTNLRAAHGPTGFGGSAIDPTTGFGISKEA